ncbi:MAG: acylneuraminate cytidylyltransferase family protein [Aquihabitans sp.]
MTDVLALIPARGGSQGIPRKNLARVGGRTLVAWAVAAAREATVVDRVIVSTDDEEIAAEAEASGAEVPFLRPAHLAEHDTTDLPVFLHALDWLASEADQHPSLVVHLRPTSPARRPGLVDAAVDRLRAHPDASSLRSVSPSPLTPWKMYDERDGFLVPLLGTLEQEAFNQPRQQLPGAWVHDGVIDVVRTETLRAGSMSGPRLLAWHSTVEEGVDVDHPDDLARAEAAVRSLREQPDR